MVKFKKGDVVRIISLEDTTRINTYDRRMLNVGDTFTINIISGSIAFDSNSWCYQLSDLVLASNEYYEIY